MNEPKKITAGDTYQWQVSFANYPASEYVLSYSIVNHEGIFAIEGDDISVVGGAFDVKLTSAISQQIPVGEYRFVGYVTKGDDRFTVYKDLLRVDPDYADISDQRTWAEQTLAAVEALIAKKATVDQASISFEGRSLSRYQPEQLLEMRTKLVRIVKKEKARLKNKSGSVKMRLK